MTQLNERELTVLNDIVDIYSETGAPVGSKVLCEQSSLGLSSASYRNIMADLEGHGYLASPHTSAGRIPTEEAFRFYAQSFVEVDDLDDDIKQQIQNHITSGKSVTDVLNDVSSYIGNMTSCTTVLSAPRLEMAELEQIEFLRLSGDRVLAVMVTNDGSVENRMINVPADISIESLNESSKHLKDIVAGKTVADARVAMMEQLMAHKNQVDNLVNDMMHVADEWAGPTNTDTALVVHGTQNLFQYPELVRDQLKALFDTFEEKRMLMALMNQVQKGDGVQIFVGADCPMGADSGCSMITSGYGSHDKKFVGTLGVVGPMRMDYKKTIQMVNYTGQLLSKMLDNRSSEVK